MIFDTHAHLNTSEFDKDREALIKECLSKGIGMINVGTNFHNSKKAVEIAEGHPGVFASVGLHPSDIDSEFMKNREYPEELKGLLEKDFDYEKYKELAKSEKVVAIGECGLDYWYRPKGVAKREMFKAEQKKVFEGQIRLAQELNLPLIIHCRSAFDDLFEVISGKGVKGVLHCFSGTKEEVERFSSLGLYFGINGIIFKMDLEEAIRKIPLNKIILETDCPYLSPKGFEERNNPLSLNIIIKELSRITGVSEEELKVITMENSQRLFNLD